MPAAVRSIIDERDGLLAFLEQQRYVLRLTAYGLTDAQARHTPTGSELSISALIKHGTEAERFWIERVAGRPAAWSYEGYMAVFRVQPEETITVLLDRHAEVTAATGPIIAGVDDLGQQVPFPREIEWFPQEDFRSVRWVLLHLIQEIARHAGHADIIRQSLDGARAFSLMAAAEQWPPNPIIVPWQHSSSTD